MGGALRKETAIIPGKRRGQAACAARFGRALAGLDCYYLERIKRAKAKIVENRKKRAAAKAAAAGV